MKQRHRDGTIARAKKAKRRKASARKQPRTQPHAVYSAEIAPEQLAYALGRIEGWLEAFAEGSALSRVALTEQVGEALYRKISGERLGAEYHMSEVRRRTSEGVKRLPEVALA